MRGHSLGNQTARATSGDGRATPTIRTRSGDVAAAAP
jgi:hypothetical protein